jgi:hypothetical protein
MKKIPKVEIDGFKGKDIVGKILRSIERKHPLDPRPYHPCPWCKSDLPINQKYCDQECFEWHKAVTRPIYD